MSGGVDPLDGGILFKPGQLPFGIATGIGRDIGDSLVERAGAVEIVEEFLIADRLKGFVSPVREQTFYFFEQSVLHHRVYPVVDTAMEFFFGQFQTDEPDMERALPGCSATKREDRPAGGQADFQRPQEAMWVELFTIGEKGRIELADFLLQPRYAILLVLLPQALAQFGIDRGNIVQPVGKSLDVQTCTSYHDSGWPVTKNISRPLQGQLLENGGIDFLTDGMRIDKIMVDRL